MRSSPLAVWAGLLSASFWLLCSREYAREPPAEGTPVAVVTGDTITAGQLRGFVSRLPAHLRSTAAGEAAVRDHLQALVDRRLMEAEGRERGLLESDEVRTKVEAEVVARLVQVVTEQQVSDSIRVTEEEVRQAYEELGMGWQLWPAHILSATEEEAWQVHRLLAAGADFGTLARERSQADDADRGGELRQWFAWQDAVPALREGTFHLEVGQFSEPIQTRDGYEIVKVLAKRRQSFEEIEPQAVKLLRQARWGQRREEFLGGLEQRFTVRYHPRHARSVLAALRGQAELSQAIAQAPLVSYRGGVLTAAAFADAIRVRQAAPVPTDSGGLFRTAQRHFLPDTLMALYARETRLDETADFRTWLADKRGQILVEALRRETLAGRVTVSQEEARAYYESHRDRYALPGEIHLTEVLVDTEEKARQILAEARQGTPMETLARERTRRPRVDEGGDLHLFASQDGKLVIDPNRSHPYHSVFEDPERHRVGEIQGPIVIQERYAVFRLDDPIEPYYLPFERVARRARSAVSRAKADSLFEGYIDSLRRARTGDVQLFGDSIARLAEPD